MAVLYGYSKTGERMWTQSLNGLDSGVIDYLGGGYILHAGGNTLNLIYLSDVGSSPATVKSIHTLPEGVTALGLTINHSRQYWNDSMSDPGFDGNQCYLAISETGDPILYSILLFEYQPSTIRFVRVVTGLGSLIPAGMSFDGNQIILKVGNVGSTEIRRFERNFRSITRVKTYASNGDHLDIAFDGQHFWSLGTTEVRYFSPEKWDVAAKAFAHGLDAPGGLTTDGNQIILMAA